MDVKRGVIVLFWWFMVVSQYPGGTLSSADQVTAFLTSAWPQGSAKFTGYMFNGTTTDPVFTYSPDSLSPNYAQLRVELPSSGNLPSSAGLTHTIVFQDGAFLRNQSVN